MDTSGTFPTLGTELTAEELQGMCNNLRDSDYFVEDVENMDIPKMSEQEIKEIQQYIRDSDEKQQAELFQQLEQLEPQQHYITSTVPVVAAPVLKASNAEKLLIQVEQIARGINDKLGQVYAAQKQVPIPIDPQSFLNLQTFQENIQTEVDRCIKELQQLVDTTILTPKEFNTLIQYQQEIGLMRKQLELYKNELRGFMESNAVPSLALVIISQPFPNSVKQNQKVEEPITIRLLTGAKYEIKPQSKLRGEILLSPNSPKKSTKNQPPIIVENAEKNLNDQGIAQFDNIKFPNGTRLKGIRLKFFTQLTLPDARGSMQPITVESPATGTIVVKTNENQWWEAEGILIKKTAFEGHAEITWYRFANWLQRRYIMATRQNLQLPARPLTSHDFRYIHRIKFDNKLVISQSQFEKFWEWFGPILHKIRYQRFLCPLWIKGFISGFLTREEVEPVLRNENIGTFLIRFSESKDSFVISYQAGDAGGGTKAKHYLMKQDDTMGARKTLADFLREFRDLVVILQLTTERETEKRILSRYDKDSALKEFYTKYKTSKQGLDGYDEEVEVMTYS